MVISSSKDPAANPEKGRYDAIKEAALERLVRDVDALFPPTPVESSIDQTKEEREEKTLARLFEFMEGGACKESFTSLVDCFEKTDESLKCTENVAKLIMCVEAHTDYYQPIISLTKSNVVQLFRDLVISDAEEAAKKPPGTLMDPEAMPEKDIVQLQELARKPANRWLRRFW